VAGSISEPSRVRSRSSTLVMHRAACGAERADGLHVQLEAFRLERILDRRPLRLVGSRLERRRAAALEFGRETHHQRREPLLQGFLGARVLDLGVEGQAHRTVDLAACIAHGNRDGKAGALARPVMNRIAAGHIAHHALLDQLVILRQQKVLAEQQRVRGEVVKRDAADLRCQRADDFGKGIQRLAGGASADSVNWVNMGCAVCRYAPHGRARALAR